QSMLHLLITPSGGQVPGAAPQPDADSQSVDVGISLPSPPITESKIDSRLAATSAQELATPSLAVIVDEAHALSVAVNTGAPASEASIGPSATHHGLKSTFVVAGAMDAIPASEMEAVNRSAAIRHTARSVPESGNTFLISSPQWISAVDRAI